MLTTDDDTTHQEKVSCGYLACSYIWEPFFLLRWYYLTDEKTCIDQQIFQNRLYYKTKYYFFLFRPYKIIVI